MNRNIYQGVTMLATLGFTITGLCFGVFAYTFDKLVIKKTKLPLQRFTAAYYCLALALLTWGVATAIGGSNTLGNSVLIGNGFLLLGTICMLDVWLHKDHQIWVWVAALAAAALLFARAVYFMPEPFMRDGILIFNTETTVAVVLGLIFLFVWLPVNMRVARQVASKIKQAGITQTYSWIFVCATLAALVFLAARRTATVILSFTALAVCFAMLIGSNVLIAKMMEQRHAKRG